MPDVFSTMMAEHLADCFQACGLSPTGAAEVANEQPASTPADQAMMKAYKPAAFYGIVGSNSPIYLPSQMDQKPAPPPGTQTVPSQTEVVLMD